MHYYRYIQAQEIPGVKVFRYEGTVMFASFEYFKSKLIEKTGCDPLIMRKLQKRAAKAGKSAAALSSSSASATAPTEVANESINEEGDKSNSGTIALEIAQTPVSSQKKPTKANEVGSFATDENPNMLTENSISITSNSSGDMSAPQPTEKLLANGVESNKITSNKPDVKQVQFKVNESEQKIGIIDNKVHHIILDCSDWAFIDDTAVKLLVDVRPY